MFPLSDGFAGMGNISANDDGREQVEFSYAVVLALVQHVEACRTSRCFVAGWAVLSARGSQRTAQSAATTSANPIPGASH